MKSYALTIIALLFFIGLAHSCTITGPETGTIGENLQFTLEKNVGEKKWTLTCENGGASSNIESEIFSCHYTTAGTKTVTITPSGSGENTPIPCTALVSLSAGNTPPLVSVSSPTSGQTLTLGNVFTFNGTASDSDGVAKVEVQITCSGVSTSWAQASGTTNWQYTWTPPANAGSTCSVKARATDTKNATATTAATSFRLEQSATNAGAAAGAGQAATATCTQSCSGKVRKTCQNNVATITPVECCAASDCTNTCSGTQYKTPTCTASNTCTYAAGQQVTGKCGYGVTCQIGRPNYTNTNAQTPIILRYQNFLDSSPGLVTIRCGNGQNVTTNCAGSNGNCTATCVYSATGTFTPAASIKGTTCTTDSLLVVMAPQNATTNSGATGGNTTTSTQQNQTRALSCSLAARSEAETGDVVSIEISYNGTTLSPGLVNVACGNGKTATAPGCLANVFGNGKCSTSCVYDAPGQFAPAVVIQGKTCTSQTITVTGNAVGGLLDNEEMDLTVESFATTPAIILADVATRLTAVVKTSQAVKTVSCAPLDNAQSSCTCSLSQTTSPNPVVDCMVQPPVQGTYQITFTSQDGKTKTALVPLTPGESGRIEVVNKGTDLTFYAVALVAVLLLAFAAYFAFSKISEKLGEKDKLYKRREALLREIDYAKVSYMKGQIGQDQFQRIYNSKQQELSDLNARISQFEKKK